MTIIELLNNVLMVVGIGFFATVFMVFVIRALGEERRKNYELSDKLLDKTFDRIEKMMKGLVKEFKDDFNSTNSTAKYSNNKYSENIGSEIKN